MTETHSLSVEGLSLGYGDHAVIHGIDLSVLPGKITGILGANACGKSTLLKSMSRLLKPTAGTVLLDGKDVHSMPAKTLARTLGLLPQSPIAPEGITVADLVGRALARLGAGRCFGVVGSGNFAVTNALREAGAEVVAVALIVDRGARARLEEEGLEYRPIFEVSDLDV